MGNFLLRIKNSKSNKSILKKFVAIFFMVIFSLSFIFPKPQTPPLSKGFFFELKALAPLIPPELFFKLINLEKNGINYLYLNDDAWQKLAENIFKSHDTTAEKYIAAQETFLFFNIYDLISKKIKISDNTLISFLWDKLATYHKSLALHFLNWAIFSDELYTNTSENIPVESPTVTTPFMKHRETVCKQYLIASLAYKILDLDEKLHFLEIPQSVRSSIKDVKVKVKNVIDIMNMKVDLALQERTFRNSEELFSQLVGHITYNNPFLFFFSIENLLLEYSYAINKSIRIKKDLSVVTHTNLKSKLSNFINKKECFFKKTLLHQAVRAKQVAIVKYLLYCGANPNLKDAKGKTPLHELSHYSIDFYKQALRISFSFILNGASLNAKNKNKITALDVLLTFMGNEIISYVMILEKILNQ